MIKSGRAGVRVDLISDFRHLKCHRKTRQLRPGFSMTFCPKGGKFKFTTLASKSQMRWTLVIEKSLSKTQIMMDEE